MITVKWYLEEIKSNHFPKTKSFFRQNIMPFKLKYIFFSFWIKNWIDTFSTLGEKWIGYAKERVTCYTHAAAYHTPNMVTRHGNLRQFSGQGKLLEFLGKKNMATKVIKTRKPCFYKFYFQVWKKQR